MGLSSSQARLLNLTTRMHQIEYKAAKLEAQKLQMANESRRVYSDYQNSLESTKIQHATLNTDGSIGYVDATYANLKEMGYQLRYDGKVIIDSATEANLKTAGDNRNFFLALQSGRVTDKSTVVDGVTEIYTVDQLLKINGERKNYRLMSDLDLTGINWNSKYIFRNYTFDGNGHTIKGLNNALFSGVDGTVKNLHVEGNSKSNAILANAAGSDANIDNVSVSGTVVNTDINVNAGALVGIAGGSNIKINNCSVNASIIASNGTFLGGLIGRFLGNQNCEISNCSFAGDIEGGTYITGGLVGQALKVDISDSIANASVSGTSCIGGFVGLASDETITNCVSKGAVNGDGSNGGFIGGSNGNLVVSNCNSYSDTAGDGFIGGSQYSGTTIKNCNSYGNTQRYGFAGTTNAVIDNCYTTSNKPFAYGTNNTVNQATTPNNNVITVTPPSIKETTKIEDNNGENSKLFDEIQQDGYVLDTEFKKLVEGHENDTKWLTNMVNAGVLDIYTTDKATDKHIQTSVATDTNLQEVADETGLKKAEAKYEADMKRIDLKDRKFDYDLAAIENERNAIKQEMETLKTVAKDNVERTFKLFS